MAKEAIDWVSVTRFSQEPIGAIGFIGNDAVAVVAFFDDRDGNKDGKVSVMERVASMLSPVNIEGMGVTEVAMAGRTDLDILQRDASFANMANKLYLSFARGLVLDGIYSVYFSRGVKMSGKGIAKQITSGMVKEMVVRKGFEKGVRQAFDAAVRR